MSFSFMLRFDTTSLKGAEIFARLEKTLEAKEIRFGGVATRLVEHEGWPTVDASTARWTGSDLETGDALHFERISEIFAHAQPCWGIGLGCLSAPNARRHGRSTAMEVDISVFHASNGKWTLFYEESSTAGLARESDEDAQQEIYDLQLALCKDLGFKLSVYDEEDCDLAPDVTLDEIRGRLERPGQCSIVIHSSVLSLEEVRKAARERAQMIRLSTASYILCPFL